MLKFNRALCCVWAACALAACTPTQDWREVHGTAAPFSVLLPAKPSSFSRQVDLEGQQVMMTMTAAEVDGVTYAVGTAALPDSEKARAALISMKTALVKNINGSIKLEKASEYKSAGITSIDIDATGAAPSGGASSSLRLVARFIAKDRQVYQVVMVGRDKSISAEAIDTFFTSFKLN